MQDIGQACRRTIGPRKEFERENRELRRANETSGGHSRDQRFASVPGPGGVGPPSEVMVRFIDDHRDEHGVELICGMLSIAPSTYYAAMRLAREPGRASAPAQQDAWLKDEIKRIREANFKVYDARKIWHQLHREGVQVARRTVERLLREVGLKGAVRGRHLKVYCERCTRRSIARDLLRTLRADLVSPPSRA